MNFPLTFRFKLIAITPQIYVTDAAGNSVFYVKQKMFRLREKIDVYRDSDANELCVKIEADRMIDWSAKYSFMKVDGTALGSVGRRGLRSLWSATYDVFGADSSHTEFVIHEQNPWAKVCDSLFGEIPVLGMLAGYVFQPKYVVERKSSGKAVMRLSKQRALLESRFVVESLEDTNDEEAHRITLSLLMMILLERKRG